MSAPTIDNRLTRALAPVGLLPRGLQPRVRSLILGRVVRFVGTAGLVVEELRPERAIIVVRNRPAVQNHIGSVHAAAIALVAETATGFVVGMNLPDAVVPVIKSMTIDFVKRARGDLRAVADLSEEQRSLMATTERGEVTPAIAVTDADGNQPIACRLVWAWTPRRR